MGYEWAMHWGTWPRDDLAAQKAILLPFLIELGRRTRPAMSAGDACTYRRYQRKFGRNFGVTDGREEM